MKRYLLTLLFTSGIIGLYGQERPIAKVHYTFKHMNDTTQREKFTRDEVVTYLENGQSWYTSYSLTRMQEETKRQMEAADFGGRVVFSKNTNAIKESYLLEPAAHSLVEVVRISRDEFILASTYPVQDWEIQDETTDIGGYTCQKATTNFRGRNYVAWFTTELPFSFGPWKLHGLPGLILSAHDDKNEVSFTYLGFDKVSADSKVAFGPSDAAIKSTPAEVEKLEKAFKANPMAYIQAKQSSAANGGKASVILSSSGTASTAGTPAGGNSFTVTGRSGSSAGAMEMNKLTSITIKNEEGYKPSELTNNPIEIDE
ncbi:GLPGLI family protein [Sphingobacterium sp. Mn56C]|uniref:GLPGLI family protein n=1 Tax=Sphingobacterium sp. Mn56C TaxID=3395261 RepID=UPI003BC0BB87